MTLLSYNELVITHSVSRLAGHPLAIGANIMAIMAKQKLNPKTYKRYPGLRGPPARDFGPVGSSITGYGFGLHLLMQAL